MGTFWKDLGGTLLGGGDYLAFRMMGDRPGMAMADTFAWRNFGFDAMRWNCYPQYNACYNYPFANWGCRGYAFPQNTFALPMYNRCYNRWWG
jgi:hypothetical protein